MDVTSIRTPGLGDATYVVAHEGLGIVIDPQRDVARFERALADADVELRYVLETHMHNDYVSGGRGLAERHAAEIVLPAGSGAAFDFTPAFHTEDLEAGRGLRIRPLHTPGHTPEHVSYLVLVDGEPVAVFSGGSLLVGSSGRPDLLSAPQAEPLARLQYVSVNRLAALPDEVGLYPTHGEGSFCTASGAGRTVSTIGDEKRTNPVLAQPDIEAFVKHTLAELQPWPAYYAHMGPANVFAPTALDDADLTAPALATADVAARAGDVAVVDARPRERFAAGHVPGALGIELSEQFGVWAGWVLPFNAPVQLVLDRDQDATEAIVQLGRIGFDAIEGILWDFAAWEPAGHAVERFRRVSIADVVAAFDAGEQPQLLDVRAPGEVEAEPLPGAIHGYVPDLVDGVPAELDAARPVWVVCGSGFRSAIAASLLARQGFEPVIVDGGGASEINQARAA